MESAFPPMQSDLTSRFPLPGEREEPEKGTPASLPSSPISADASDEVPFLRRVPFSSRRRRAVSESHISYLSSHPNLRRSFSREVGHAAAETYLLTRLTLILLRYLGVGYRWITKFLSLVCYATLLMPGFLQVGYYYFFSSQVRRSIIYGDQPRNSYKAWGSLLGRRLAERGIIVACIDYRNFPQGTISDMVKDASEGISFVCNNISSYGGDPNRIYLMGQSAGAHIAACALVHQAIKECGEDDTSWSISQIKAYFGLSGGYNMINLVDHFHRRGLYRSIFLSIMEGEQSLSHFSPEVIVTNMSDRFDFPPLPPIILYHGTDDCSIPSDASTAFAEALQSKGFQAKVVLYESKTHTDLFLQDPLRGGRDELLEDIVSIIHTGDAAALARDVVAPPARRLVPEMILQLARKISPF